MTFNRDKLFAEKKLIMCFIFRAAEFESNVEAMKVEFTERNVQAQERLATLDRQIAEFRSHSEGTTQGVMADTDNIKVAWGSELITCMLSLYVGTIITIFI